MASFNKAAGAALIFGVLYLGLWVWMVSGYISGRYKLRSRWTLLLFHVTVRVASQVSTRMFIHEQVEAHRQACVCYSKLLLVSIGDAERLAAFFATVSNDGLPAWQPEIGNLTLTIVCSFCFVRD